MNLFTGIEYLKIDIANNQGLDKLNYDERIKQTDLLYPANTIKEANNSDLKELIALNKAEEPELVFAGLIAYRSALNGEPSGYRVSFDSCCSGSQLMSALTRDRNGLNLTGMITNQRMDLYTEVFKRFKQISGSDAEIERKHIKKAVMVSNYGSKQKPERVLGKHNIPAFHQTMEEMCEGAWTLRQVLLDCWNPDKSIQEWIMPDGFNVHCPVEVKNTYSFENNGEVYEFQVSEIEPTKTGLSNVANCIHSVDGFIVRELIRRTKFDIGHVQYVCHLLNQYTLEHEADLVEENHSKFDILIHMFESSNMLSVEIINYIQSIADVARLSTNHRNKLKEVLIKMYKQGTFDLVVIHDSFTTLPNNMNYVRYWYNDIIANIVDSDLLQVLLNQISPYYIELDRQLTSRKQLAQEVRNSSYGIC